MRAAAQTCLCSTQFNQQHLAQQQQQSELEARIRSYELAFRMQAAAPEAVDLSKRPRPHCNMYGLDQKETEVFRRNCLLARRLVERGVRFVQLYSGTGSKWDSHTRDRKEPLGYVPLDGQAGGRAARRPQAAWAARGHAGRLGRRIRPHADERERGRPRPQPDRVLDLDGRRRRARAARPSAPPTNSVSTPSKTGCTCATSTPRSSGCSARQHDAHLQPLRPARTTHHQRRRVQ